jgi:hypothetical protein
MKLKKWFKIALLALAFCPLMPTFVKGQSAPFRKQCARDIAAIEKESGIVEKIEFDHIRLFANSTGKQASEIYLYSEKTYRFRALGEKENIKDMNMRVYRCANCNDEKAAEKKWALVKEDASAAEVSSLFLDTTESNWFKVELIGIFKSSTVENSYYYLIISRDED